MVGNLIKAIRPLNLLIVVILQVLLYSTVLLPAIESPRLSNLTLGGFVLASILLTASGYLINDYFDYDGDKINKKDWHQLTPRQLIIGTVVMIVIGGLLSLWVAYSIDQLIYASIYVIAAILLYTYSAWGKRQPLIGNLMVATFCGGSIAILILSEWPALKIALDQNPQGARETILLIIGLSIFAFLITLVRELAKDVEDIEGDQVQGYNTFPINSGIPRTKMMIIWYSAITLLLAIWWLINQWNSQSLIATSYFAVGVIGSLAYLVYRASHLHENASYTLLSKLCKSVMVIGIVYVVLV